MLIAQDADRAKPATAETDDLIALAQGANGDRADRGIQPRHIPAAGQNTDYALLGGDVGHTPFNLEGFPTSSNWTQNIEAWDQGPMAAQRGFNKMIKALGLHYVPIRITGSRSATAETEC